MKGSLWFPVVLKWVLQSFGPVDLPPATTWDNCAGPCATPALHSNQHRYASKACAERESAFKATTLVISK